ncbi:MAG TPA: MerR family transcriptional regulator [Thermoleophilaceae bacterium]
MKEGLTINEAAETTGWSPRMLRYLETVGLIEPPRTGAGYRIYGPGELQRLRTLRELLDRHGLGPSDVAFAKRMRDESELEDAVARWLTEKAEKPEDVQTSGWLDYEQQKHQRLLAV